MSTTTLPTSTSTVHPHTPSPSTPDTAPAGTLLPPTTRTSIFNDGREDALYTHLLADSAKYHHNPPALLHAIETYARDPTHLLMIFSHAKAQKARDVLLTPGTPPPKTILELGTYIGFSAIAWGVMLRDFHGPDAKGIHVYAIEANPHLASLAQSLIALVGLDDIIEVLPLSSQAAMAALHARGVPAPDMLFLDHWEEAYVPDLRAAAQLGLLKMGALVVADNTDFPGAPEYVEYVRGGGEEGLRVESKGVLAEEEPVEWARAIEVTRVLEVDPRKVGEGEGGKVGKEGRQ